MFVCFQSATYCFVVISGTSKSTSSPDDTSNKMDTEVGENSFVIFSNDEYISLSLEYYLPTTKTADTGGENSTSSGDSNGDNQAKKRANGDTHVSEEVKTVISVVVVLRSPIHANEPSEYSGMLYRTSNRVLNNGIKVIILICMDGTSQYHHHRNFLY